MVALEGTVGTKSLTDESWKTHAGACHLYRAVPGLAWSSLQLELSALRITNIMSFKVSAWLPYFDADEPSDLD